MMGVTNANAHILKGEIFNYITLCIIILRTCNVMLCLQNTFFTRVIVRMIILQTILGGIHNLNKEVNNERLENRLSCVCEILADKYLVTNGGTD